MSRLYSIAFGSDLIGEIAGIIAEDTGSQESTVVFPGKRPSLYLKARLAAVSKGKAFFPPGCCSLDEFIDHIACKRRPAFADLGRADAVWLLYGLVRSLPAFDRHPFRKKGFGDFFHWGRHLLDFIDRLDTEGIDNNALLDVEKNAAIGYDVPSSVNELLANICVLRGEFHKLLQDEGWFTRGTKHIAALEEVREKVPLEPAQVIFAGLFGLTGTECEIVKHFWDAGETTIVIEGDPADWPVLKDLVSYLRAEVEHKEACPAPAPSVRLHSGHDAHAQVIEAYRIICKENHGKTAVVLPVSDHLFPLLNFVTDRTDLRCNISMGYPVERTSIFDLVRRVLNVLIQKRPDGLYPSGEYLAVMLHPFVKNIAPDTELRGLLSHIEQSLAGTGGQASLSGRPLVTLPQIEKEASEWEASRGKTPASGSAGEALAEIHRLFFINPGNTSTIRDLATCLEEALEAILLKTPVRSYILSGAVFSSLLDALGSLKSTLFCNKVLSADPAENTRTLCDLTLLHLGGNIIPFDTRPIEQVEIIGMLEARNISFDRVIILDVNEGVLPGPREINPLVPLGVFETLGIPPPEFTEAIYRYNFYRLTGSAKDVHLIYCSAEDRPRSRYIEEMLWEEEKKQGKLSVIPSQHTVLAVNLKRESSPPFIEKTDAMIASMRQRGLSPSAVDTYVRCPLSYYFSRLIGLEKRQVFSEDIETTDRGGIIHGILLETFRPFLGLALTKEMEDDVRSAMEKAIKTYFDASPPSGEFYLFQRIAAYKLDSFLKKHMRDLDGPVVIEHLEERFAAALQTEGVPIKLSGRIDRVDHHSKTDSRTVIDYKTGTSKQYPAKITQKTDFSSILSIHEHVPSFQLPMYMLMFSAQQGVPLDRMDAKLILLGSNSEETFLKGKADTERKALLDAYMTGIETVVSHMFDPRKPFTAFDNDLCMDCPVKSLCHV
ncbi:MAG TPA: PD-(D/E)XK nuclease family protein [Syntrophorhabdaceae bacterium]|nr:PD-(D/E)XK nuclease family protein [Syntrophorhabdaceae bacterium]